MIHAWNSSTTYSASFWARPHSIRVAPQRRAQVGRRRTSRGRGEVFPANALREVFDDQKWEHQVVKQVRDVRLICPEDLLAQLIGHIQFLLEKYIDPATDRMGHAFPIIGSGDTEHTASQDNGLLAVAWTSSVDTFARALIAGAAVIGLEQTTKSYDRLAARMPRTIPHIGIAPRPTR